VYYTPTYIVDYIVKNTLGKLVEGKKPGPRGGVSNLRILDPACGSGSFLIGAYQFLLDWHRDQYVNDGPGKWTKGKTPRLYQSQKGEWQLTTDERKRILLNNIYGVDIDHQAVEVTKLSLLLKVLEGEDEQSIGKQMKLFQERVLPDLSNNIKCGNSLIGPDFYDNQQMNIFDEEEMYRVNAFDWEAEFANIMESEGFDTVIGNPPWGAEFSEDELSYLRKINKDIIVRMIDSFMYFVYQSSNKVKTSGYFGMILPDVVLYQNDNEKLRKYIINHFRVRNILNMGDVFDKVSRPSAILIFEKNNPTKYTSTKIADLTLIRKNEKDSIITKRSHYEEIKQKDWDNLPGNLFITSEPEKYKIWTKINETANKLLSEVVDNDGIQRGVSPDLKEAFLVDSDTAKKFQLEKNKLKKVVTGGVHVKRYFISQPDLWLIYTLRDDDFQKLPKICNYIDQFKNKITCKEVKKGKHPIYSLHRPRKESIFLKNEKIVGVITGDRIIVALDDCRIYPTDGLYLFGVDKTIKVNYLLGILNSKLFVFIYRLLTIEKGRVLPQVKPKILANLPIRDINIENSEDKAQYNKIVNLVQKILDLNKKLSITKIPHTKDLLKRQIESTDKQIDQLVYELYDLTDEEIKIVESKS
jgi:type I restriction-modification system DNA methylase subunit